MKPEFDINTERTLLGAAIRDARKRSGLTQDQAAGALDITQSQLSMLENGRRRLSADMALKMSAVYGENIAETGLPKLKEGSAAEALTALLEFAGRSGSDKLVQSAENYISLCCYLLLRNIYLANPHNSERIFSLSLSAIGLYSSYVMAAPMPSSEKDSTERMLLKRPFTPRYSSPST